MSTTSYNCFHTPPNTDQRLILLRNALIALSVMVFVVVIAFACYRQAYRQTLTIAGFDAPEKLAERGIAGQVIAKALFDELIKRRELVTTLESANLRVPGQRTGPMWRFLRRSSRCNRCSDICFT